MSRTDIKRHNYIISLMSGLTIIISLLAVNICYGVPANPRIHELIQPDGSAIKARMWGDEWMKGWETVEGYSIVKNEKGYWVFANKNVSSNRLEATNTLASNKITPSGLQTHLRPARPMTYKVSGNFPTTGDNNIPVLLINYSDTETVYTPQNFQSLLFGNHPSIAAGPGSMRDFYLETSYNALSILSGPSGISGWHTAEKAHDEYGDNNGPFVAAELVKEAILAADEAGFDFSKYDNDKDGRVDVIMIVHQGGGAETGDSTCIWSHSWSLNNSGVGAVTVDGVIADDYIIQPETLFGGISTIGVFCHEFGHAMGLPDLYDYGYDSAGAGDFCLMASGSWGGIMGESPIFPSAFCKTQLGWVRPTEISNNGAYSLAAIANTPVVYKIQGEEFSDTEYFLIENRQGISFDAALPGEQKGMLIWHIDERQEDNDDQSHYLVDLEEASGVQHLETYDDTGDDLDYFRSGNLTEFNDNTIPNSQSYTGGLMKMGIRQISSSSSVMSFFVDVVAYRLKSCCMPAGSGTIVKNPAQNVFSENEPVQMLAIAGDGWKFVRWEGDVSDVSDTANPITVSMTASRTIHAIFQPCYRIQVIPTGQGQVQKSVNETNVSPNTQITLTAIPAEGWVFRKWWGDVDSSANPITVTANSNKLIQAEFVNPSLENHPLTINAIGDGRVFPFGGSFADGSEVTLTATPNQGWKFVQWRGDIVSKDNPLTITMDQAKCITGVFIEENAPMPADETVQSDESQSKTTLATTGTPQTDLTEKSGDFEFSNLFNSCTLPGTVLIGFMFGGFCWIRGKQ